MIEKGFLKESSNGKGVFANEFINKGEQILTFNGKLFSREQLPNPYEVAVDHFVQIGRDLYMGPSGGLDDFVNHSCDPNSGIVFTKGALFLIAIRDIIVDEEICWDYSTSIDDDWTLKCNCHCKECRCVIGRFTDLPAEIQQKYIQLGITPDFVRKN